MSANVRPDTKRNNALAWPVVEAADWWLQIECACGAQRTATIGALWPRPPDGALLAQMIPRLRCSRCRRAPERVVLMDRARDAVLRSQLVPVPGRR